MNSESVFILLAGGFIWGYLFTKIPLNKNDLLKWYYPFKNIDYYVCHLLENGRVIDTNIVKAKNTFYTRKEIGYSLINKENEGEKENSIDFNEVPYITINKHKTVFHNINNINPMKFKQNKVEPLCNDPEIYATLLRNKEIKDTLAPNLDEFVALKQFIAMFNIVCVGCFAGLMYFLLKL